MNITTMQDFPVTQTATMRIPITIGALLMLLIWILGRVFRYNQPASYRRYRRAYPVFTINKSTRQEKMLSWTIKRPPNQTFVVSPARTIAGRRLPANHHWRWEKQFRSNSHYRRRREIIRQSEEQADRDQGPPLQIIAPQMPFARHIQQK